MFDLFLTIFLKDGKVFKYHLKLYLLKMVAVRRGRHPEVVRRDLP